jgi:DNA-directed RNA polymerase specialized sigma24 family protein
MTNPWFGYQITDPAELESRFSNDDSLSYIDPIHEDPSDDTLYKLEKIRDLIDALPPREADFIDLYFFRKKKQTDIAKIFGVTQPTVCYRLKRAKKRIKFLVDLPKISREEIRERMAEFLTEELDVDIMVLMFDHTCQSAVASELNVSQGKVRHRFMRTLEKMEKKEEMADLLDLFKKISGKLNIRREVKRNSDNEDIRYILD